MFSSWAPLPRVEAKRPCTIADCHAVAIGIVLFMHHPLAVADRGGCVSARSPDGTPCFVAAVILASAAGPARIRASPGARCRERKPQGLERLDFWRERRSRSSAKSSHWQSQREPFCRRSPSDDPPVASVRVPPVSLGCATARGSGKALRTRNALELEARLPRAAFRGHVECVSERAHELSTRSQS